MLTITVLAFFS